MPNEKVHSEECQISQNAPESLQANQEGQSLRNCIQRDNEHAGEGNTGPQNLEAVHGWSCYQDF